MSWAPALVVSAPPRAACLQSRRSRSRRLFARPLVCGTGQTDDSPFAFSVQATAWAVGSSKASRGPAKTRPRRDYFGGGGVSLFQMS
jgi:hypothetical protein